MTRHPIVNLLALALYGCSPQLPVSETPPSFMLGEFVDDYEIHYSVSEAEWVQLPGTRFRIDSWNGDDQIPTAATTEAAAMTPM